jgi:hypothetical protein
MMGIAMNGDVPIPYKKTALTPNLGAVDSSDDIRGGLGIDGLAELKRFVEAGGTLIGDGTTVEMLANYGLAVGVSTSVPPELYTKGAILRGQFADQASPIAYGYAGKELPIYFSEAPVVTVASSGGGGDAGGSGANVAQNVTPNAVAVRLSPWTGSEPAAVPVPDDHPEAAPAETVPPRPRSFGAEATQHPRTVMQFPAQADRILLSGMLNGGGALARKALIVDVPDRKGHWVMFALRPFWRWQTQGSYSLAFNAILNWDHLDAGTPPTPAPAKIGQ